MLIITPPTPNTPRARREARKTPTPPGTCRITDLPNEGMRWHIWSGLAWIRHETEAAAAKYQSELQTATAIRRKRPSGHALLVDREDFSSVRYYLNMHAPRAKWRFTTDDSSAHFTVHGSLETISLAHAVLWASKYARQSASRFPLVSPSELE